MLNGQPVPLASCDVVLCATSRLLLGTRRIKGSQLSASRFSRVVLVLRLFAGQPDLGTRLKRPQRSSESVPRTANKERMG